MRQKTTRTVELARHPASTGDAVHAIRVALRREGADSLRFSYSITGDLRRLRIPPAAPIQRTDGLWRHTCLEAFVALEGTTAYLEFNFSPSGEWAAYAFRRYRERESPDPQMPAPRISVQTKPHSLSLDARVRLAFPAPERPRAPLRLGLCAVVEELGGTLSYWALAHPLPEPDFHDRAAFTVTLPADVDSPGDPR